MHFNADEALAPFPAVPVGHDYDIVADPASTEEFTGINGNPPGAVAVQGYQLFDVDHTTGTATSSDVVGTFDADVTTTVNRAGDQSETLLATADVSGTPGTAPGDVPLPGSVIDTSTFGDSGLENIYSDLASTTPGTDVISDTLVTPIGDLTIPLHVEFFANLSRRYVCALLKLALAEPGGRPTHVFARDRRTGLCDRLYRKTHSSSAQAIRILASSILPIKP